MHELSLGTWFIHITSLLEWIIAILLISILGKQSSNRALICLGLAMLPNLCSAMAAITWHIYDNSYSLKGLVVLQAGLTMFGNIVLAFAAWNLYRFQEQQST